MKYFGVTSYAFPALIAMCLASALGQSITITPVGYNDNNNMTSINVLNARDWPDPGGTSSCHLAGSCNLVAPLIMRTNAGERAYQAEPSRGVFSPTWGNLFSPAPDGWQAQATLHHSQLMYTFGAFPAWMGSRTGAASDIDSTNESCFMRKDGSDISSSVPPTNALISATGDCMTLEMIHKFMQMNCALAAQPAVPTHNRCKIHYIEGWNEFSGNGFWTDTYAHLAKQMVDMDIVIKKYCSDCYFMLGSTSAGGNGYSPANLSLPLSGNYEVAIGAALDRWHDYTTSIRQDIKPDIISFHNYPSHNDVSPSPFPETMISGDGLGKGPSTGSALCTAAGGAAPVPNKACQAAMIEQGKKLRAVLNTRRWLPKTIPLWNTESSYIANSALLVDTTRASFTDFKGNVVNNAIVTGPKTDMLRAAYTARTTLLQANMFNVGTLVNIWYQEDNNCYGSLVGFGDHLMATVSAGITTYKSSTGRNVICNEKGSQAAGNLPIPPGLTPAGKAFNKVAGWIAGARFLAACSGDGSDPTHSRELWGCDITQADGTAARIEWYTGFLSTKPYRTTYMRYSTLDGTVNNAPVIGGMVTAENRPILLTGSAPTGRQAQEARHAPKR